MIINKKEEAMAKNYIVKELINEMKERIPQGQNLANYLTDTLYMGKEAVYRRLRGEVAARRSPGCTSGRWERKR